MFVNVSKFKGNNQRRVTWERERDKEERVVWVCEYVNQDEEDEQDTNYTHTHIDRMTTPNKRKSSTNTNTYTQFKYSRSSVNVEEIVESRTGNIKVSLNRKKRGRF